MTPPLSPSEREKRLAELEKNKPAYLCQDGCEGRCKVCPADYVEELLSLARQPLPFRLPSEKPDKIEPFFHYSKEDGFYGQNPTGVPTEEDWREHVETMEILFWMYLSDILVSFEQFLQEHEASMKGEPKNAG